MSVRPGEEISGGRSSPAEHPPAAKQVDNLARQIVEPKQVDRKKHGRSSYIRRGCRCEICVSAQRGYYQDTKEARLAYSRKYRAENKEKCLETMRVYREANRDRYLKDTPARKLRHRESSARRRSLELSTAVERVEYHVVFERDNYTCQSCGVVCPKDSVFPDRNFPSLDHIVPLSRGGAHTYENVQCLCLGCNLSKGSRLEERPA